MKKPLAALWLAAFLQEPALAQVPPHAVAPVSYSIAGQTRASAAADPGQAAASVQRWSIAQPSQPRWALHRPPCPEHAVFPSAAGTGSTRAWLAIATSAVAEMKHQSK